MPSNAAPRLGRRLPAAAAALGAAAACLLPAAASAAEPSLGPTSAQLVRLVLGLVVVVVVLVLAARILPRLGGGALVGGGALRVVAQLQLGQRERVAVVQVGERQILVGIAPGRVEALHVLETPLPAGERPGQTLGGAGPQGWLARTLQGRRP